MGKRKPNFSDKEDPKQLTGAVQTTDQQAAKDDSLQVECPASGNTTIKEVDEPKAAINTAKAADVVTGSSAGSTSGTPSIGLMARGLSSNAVTFGGGAGGIAGDNSATTHETRSYKSGGRTGRQADPITRKIDYVDAEMFVTKRHQSKPLYETNEGIGYNGNYYNEHVLSQRTSGATPADPIYERSVDEVDVDMLYFTAGQIVDSNAAKAISIRSYDVENQHYETDSGDKPINRTFPLGNYIARDLVVKINKDGQITDFHINSHDASQNNTDEAVTRVASDALFRERNQRELDRNIMIEKAGNESDPGWSALGDGIVNSSDQNYLLAEIDALAGDIVYMSERKLAMALAHQVNKVAKDGSRVTGPMAEMVNGLIPVYGAGADSAVSEQEGRAACFDPANYVKGSAALWLAVNDSLAKYTSKGKLLSLPLSFKSALATARSNHNPLRCHKQFTQVVSKNELYSTIDGPYDPLKPVVITDKAGLITPLPIDVHHGDTPLVEGNYDATLYTMHYENLRNKYNIDIKNFLIDGIFRWFKERGSRIYDVCKTEAVGDIVTLTIPVCSSTTSISLWDLIVCSSVPYIVESRLYTYTEVLKYERNHGYPYTGLEALKDINIDEADNYSLSGDDGGISVATAKPVAALKVMLPEVFWPIAKFTGEQWDNGHNGVGAYTVLPYYFSQNQFVWDTDDTATRKFVLSETPGCISYPTTRSGQTYSYLDTIYGMSEEDYKLALDRMVVYPAYDRFTCKFARDDARNAAYKEDVLTYKYGMTGDGIPVIPYFAYANDAANKSETLTVLDIIATPRELGLLMVAPAGLLTPVPGSQMLTLNKVDLNSSYLGLSGPSFRVKYYHGNNEFPEDILDKGNMDITYNQSLKYMWSSIYANPFLYSNAAKPAGLDISINANVHSDNYTPVTEGAYDVDITAYDPLTGTYQVGEHKVNAQSSAIAKLVSINTDHVYNWFRMQRLPFIINPFDCNTDDLTVAKDEAINKKDIFDFLYMFGLAGFRASDYNRLINAKAKERVAMGMNYVSNPFVDKSMLLK